MAIKRLTASTLDPFDPMPDGFKKLASAVKKVLPTWKMTKVRPVQNSYSTGNDYLFCFESPDGTRRVLPQYIKNNGAYGFFAEVVVRGTVNYRTLEGNLYFNQGTPVANAVKDIVKMLDDSLARYEKTGQVTFRY